MRVLLALAAAGAACARTLTLIPPWDPSVLTQGRVSPEFAFDWEGVQFEVTVTGATFVNVSLGMPTSVKARFRVFVDGDGSGPQVSVSGVANSTAMQSFALVTGLSPTGGSHNIRIYNVAEPVKTGTSAGPMRFGGFITDGAPAPSTPRSRRIEFVGDSITAGSGCIGTAPCVEQLSTTDHSLSYGALLCAAFDANCSFVAYSGKGMYENCCDVPAFSGERMPSYWRQTFGGASYLFDWQPSRFVPDAMLINLGTNDFGHGHDTGPAWEANFTATYMTFIRNATAAYGGNTALPIFAGVGAITDVYGPVVQRLVAAANAEGFNLTYVAMMGCPASGCGGCNGHPNTTQHAAMAALAQPIIASVMGW